MKYKGDFRISCVHSNRDDDFAQIELVDKTSGRIVVQIQASLLEFANALFSRGRNHCEFELIDNSDYVGSTHEHKKEVVFVPNHEYQDRELVAAMAIQPHEVDGWEGRTNDAMNHHRLVRSRDGGAEFSVSFDRWVRPDGTPVIKTTKVSA